MTDPAATPDIAVDMGRLLHELERTTRSAMTAGLTDELAAGLAVRRCCADDHPGAQVFITLAGGTEVGSAPLYRVREYDLDLLRHVTAQLVAELPARIRQRVVGAFQSGSFTVDSPCDSDWITVAVDGEEYFRVHRRRVVPGWPPDE